MTLPRPRSVLMTVFCLLAGVGLTLSTVGCNSLKEIVITPASGVEVLTAIGQTVQFTAVGASQMGSATPTTSNVTGSVTWASSNTNVATINANGVATATGAGYAQITAQSNGVVATSDVTVFLSVATPATPVITITPSTVTETFVGETTQFLATGTLTGTGSSQNLTNMVQWVSSNVQVATINSSGLATAVGAGTTTVTAQANGLITTATLAVAASANTPAAESLGIIPSATEGASATFQGETTQFIAIGNLTGTGTAQNLTNNVLWSSSDVSVATIDQNGLATAVGANVGSNPSTTVITAIGTTTGGSLITASSALTVSPANGTVTLPTLTVYETGTSTGSVASAPASITCGAGASGTVCSGTFQLNAVVTLTATPTGTFGGWSSNCAVVAGNPLQCTIKMSGNETVGAIFNK